jgi:hypothetical protein
MVLITRLEGPFTLAAPVESGKPLGAETRAARLAAADVQPIEPWRPSASSEAGAAATHAQAHVRPIESWKPSASSRSWAAVAATAANNEQMIPREEYPVPVAVPRRESDWSLRGALGAMKNATPSGGQPTTTAARRDSGISVPEEEGRTTAMYSHLEEAARQRAEERLSQIGHALPPPVTATATTAARRASIVTTEDQHGVDRPRSISLSSGARARFNLSESDEDREAAERRKRGLNAVLLMETAKKNVEARLSEQDREIAERRRLVYREEWARLAVRQAEEEVKDFDTHIDIGGGAHITEEELRRVAERNVQPLLQEMDQRSEEHRQQQREKKEQEMTRKLSKNKEKRSILGVRRASWLGGERKAEEGMAGPLTLLILLLTSIQLHIQRKRSARSVQAQYHRKSSE